jgi:hypothetical protein
VRLVSYSSGNEYLPSSRFAGLTGQLLHRGNTSEGHVQAPYHLYDDHFAASNQKAAPAFQAIMDTSGL